MLAALSWCALMGAMTEKAELAKRAGRPQVVAEVIGYFHTDSRLREAEAMIAKYVYQGNDDNGLSPKQMGRLVKQVCEVPVDVR